MKDRKMKMFYAAICFCFTCSMLAGGCSSGLQRTDISKLERKDFPTIGISMELPANPKRLIFCDSPEFKKEWKYKVFSFSMHPVYPGGLTEPLYLINVQLVYLDKSEYDSYQRESHYAKGYQWFKDIKFHKDITEFNVMHPDGRTPVCCYRRDFKNEKTGDVILAAITYLDNYEGNMQYRDQDVEAIKQMLNSIKFIDDKSTAPNSSK